MELLQLKEVSKEYGKNGVLQDINLTINREDIVGIIGESGSGKTTLLNLLAGLIMPSYGEVIYYTKTDHIPKDLNKHFRRIKKHLGYTPQHFSFYPKLTVKENILHFGKMYGMDRNTLTANAKSLLEFTGLYEHRNKLAEHLSGGMQKRLDISCSLTHKPKILLLDEPTADLDPLLQEEILKLITEVNKQGVTIVIASHQFEGLEKTCNKLAILNQGKLHSFGDVEEIRKPYLKDHVTINIKTGKEKEKITELAKRLPVSKIIDQGHRLVIYPTNVEGALGALLRAVEQDNMYLHDIDIRKPSLNEIFAQIAKK